MKKLLLLLLLPLNFINIANADAICNDGWISESTGSGTCSWHGGVREWLPNGWCSKDCDCWARLVAQKYAQPEYPEYYSGTYSTAMQGCLEGQTQGQLLKIISGSTGNSNNSSLRYRFLEKGSTWRKRGNTFTSAGGKRCTDYAYESKCNNGVTYRPCGNSICGTDGTSYKRVGSCTYTSFGAACCGKGTLICR
jgi:hypothetical protein